MSSSSLPPSTQSWSHSTITVDKLKDALESPQITAIEADILMGTVVATTTTAMPPKMEPIMAHPPDTTSELSAQRFLEMMCDGAAESNGNDDAVAVSKKAYSLRKHMKLDFKEMAAVRPSLEAWTNLKADSNGKTMFLNADIVPGPGRSDLDIAVPADEFLTTCLEFAEKDKNIKSTWAFSLGFKVDVINLFGHTDEHLDLLSSYITKYELMKRSAGVVLAINARLLSKRFRPFDKFLTDFPSSELLVWTGSGEPPISTGKLTTIKTHFQSKNLLERVGFDCQTCGFFPGVLYDTVILVLGLWKIIKESFPDRLHAKLE